MGHVVARHSVVLSGLLALTFWMAPVVRAEDTANPGKLQEATAFFERLVQESRNPYVTAMAREGLAKLSNPSSARSTQTTRSEIRVFEQPDSSVAVPAIVNNTVMGTFVVDTGSSYTVITPRMAQKLGISVTPDTPRISIITANGHISAPKVMLKNVVIGNVRVNQVEAVIQDLGKDVLLSGLLGMNFFKDKTLTIRNDRLILESNVPGPQDTLLSQY